MSTESAHAAAEHFLKNETPFHLGDMLTEQSHPLTRRLSQTLAENTAQGIELLLRVDDDIPPVADRVLASPQFAKLQTDIHETLRAGGRIIYSGCGATGRLAILLDTAHRKFCLMCECDSEEEKYRDFFKTLAEQTTAIMTGGDFALIRSVESFEDYISFGHRQARDIGINARDCLIAISEGGETSSVIGTIHAALEAGARTHFLFNNPAALLVQKVERSRAVITDPRVNTLDLATGPMAIAGSTRMQATTIELLIAGLAHETALFAFLTERLPASLPYLQYLLQPATGLAVTPAKGLAHFRRLLRQLRSPKNIRALAAWVDFERDIYAASGLVTYFATGHLLDILTDTTERSPTFKTPPFRSEFDPASDPVSWAFTKDPMNEPRDVWRALFEREPRCINWKRKDYRAMGAAERIIQNPPKIDLKRLEGYAIGCDPDPDPTRTAVRPNVAIAFLVGVETQFIDGPNLHMWYNSYKSATVDYERRAAVAIGRHRPASKSLDKIFFIEADIPPSPLEILPHLAAKLALNNVSTATMAKLGRVTGNWMTHVDATNKKLIDRSIRLVAELAAVDYATACHALHETLDEMAAWPEPRRKTTSPAAHTIKRLAGRDVFSRNP